MYTYYRDPPFSINSQGSLTLELAKWLSDRSAGRFLFKPVHLPRRRLDNLIAADNWHGVVAWANPIWFKDPEQHHYLWSIPFVIDANLIASHRDRPVIYQSPASLSGLKLGGIYWHQMVDYEPMIRTGEIIREDAISEEANILKIKTGRIDVTSIKVLSLTYLYKHHPDIDSWLYIAPKPRHVFQRHLLTDLHHPDLMNYLNQQLLAIENDPHWVELLSDAYRHIPKADLEKYLLHSECEFTTC